MTVKRVRQLLWGSPFVLLQILMFSFMSYESIKGAFIELQDHPVSPLMFTIFSMSSFFLAMVSMFKTFITHPGVVTPALINKLKH